MSLVDEREYWVSEHVHELAGFLHRTRFMPQAQNAIARASDIAEVGVTMHASSSPIEVDWSIADVRSSH